jgi:hypothetical protein
LSPTLGTQCKNKNAADKILKNTCQCSAVVTLKPETMAVKKVSYMPAIGSAIRIEYLQEIEFLK